MLERLELLIPPPIVALLAAFAMWGGAQIETGWSLAFSYQAWLGCALIAIGAAFDLISIFGFMRMETTVSPLSPENTSSLVSNGLYRFSRNPMYLGLLLILAGIAVLLGALLNIGVLAGFIVYITVFQIKPEEAKLEKIFGAEYVSYKGRVGRWV